MKRLLPILMSAARLSKASLRGEGYETVGEQLEHIVPSEPGTIVTRRIMLESVEYNKPEDLPTKLSHPPDGYITVSEFILDFVI
mmetsp:Transcript_32718/g.66757  ORF Transcript_32718/g.66757 Transcript_32718/m.66757 type:complete len:84 (-) Transcript_32718:1605-1856(-)